MANTNTTAARPYFTVSAWHMTSEDLAEKRLNDLCGLRKESAYYSRQDVECPPAYREAMRLIEREAIDMQKRVADMIASAEKLAQLQCSIEQKIADYQDAFEREGEASEEFTISDAKILVNEACQDIENFQY